MLYRSDVPKDVDIDEFIKSKEKYWVDLVKAQFNFHDVQDNKWHATPAFRKAVSDGVKKRFAEDPEYRRKTSEASSKRRYDVDVRQRMSKSHQGKMSEPAKRGWETRKANGNGAISDEQKKKIGDKNRKHRKDKPLSPEHRQHIKDGLARRREEKLKQQQSESSDS